MILIITYDLKTPKDYHDFFEAIKAQGEQGKWWHYMTSTWLLSTNKTPKEVAEAIQPKMDTQDLLFVCQLAPQYQGWLPKAAWDWIAAELPTFDLSLLLRPMGMTPPPSAPTGGIPNLFTGLKKPGEF